MKSSKWKEPKTPLTLAYAKKLLSKKSPLRAADFPDSLAEAKMAQIKLLRLCRKIQKTGGA